MIIALLCSVISIIINFNLLYTENGVTPSGFNQLDAEDFDDIGLTKIGKKLILKILAEVVCAPP